LATCAALLVIGDACAEEAIAADVLILMLNNEDMEWCLEYWFLGLEEVAMKELSKKSKLGSNGFWKVNSIFELLPRSVRLYYFNNTTSEFDAFRPEINFNSNVQ